MQLTAGDKLGPYEILALIGAGGMGEVYKARDTRLDRIVALKTSKTGFSERFEREARAVAALNHPHICTLHDVGSNYLVMEYIEGTPLHGPLPVDQALKYAVQICDALDAAHRKGITHRDLKPANILVSKAGIKLLDFGLAKLGPTVRAEEATMTLALTGKGQVFGTLLYMSPEQINGQEVDTRSDIFSFGLVLYEILKGKRAFEGLTPSSVMGAILERPSPSISDVAPVELDRVLKRCLEKDRENRWQSARDLKAGLEWIAAAEPGRVAPGAGSRFRGSLWIAVSVLLGALGIVLWAPWRQEPPVAEPVRFQISGPQGRDIVNSAISPDGRQVAMTVAGSGGRNHVWIRSLESVEARELPDTDTNFGVPFWSFDSKWIVFGGSDRTLRKINVSGGPAEILCELKSVLAGGSWNSDGVILFGGPGGVTQVAASGGAPTTVVPIPLGIFPSFLPDQRHFIYTGQTTRDSAAVVAIGSLSAQATQQTAASLTDVSSPASNTASLSGAAYAPRGPTGDAHLVFRRGSALMAQSFDAERQVLLGGAVLVADRVAAFSVSTSNLIYRTARAPNSQLTWLSRAGLALTSFGEPGEFTSVALAPGSGRAALVRLGESGPDIWVADTGSGRMERFTSGGTASNPIWSADGEWIAYNVARGIYRKRSNGVGQEELLFAPDVPSFPNSWSVDGRYILLVAGSRGITALDVESRKAFPLWSNQFRHHDCQFSPDGRWIAYVSDESGRDEVYVQSFVPGAAGAAPTLGTRSPVSVGGGGIPSWRMDGRELVYTTPDQTLQAVAVNANPFSLGEPKLIFKIPSGVIFTRLSGDHQRVLAAMSMGQSGPAPLVVVLNWQAGLKK